MGTERIARVRFVYAGDAGLTEVQVKQAMEATLRREGWQVDVNWGRAHGINIETYRGAERLVLEAKGEGSLSTMHFNFFLDALGELLQRMDSPETWYGLALPAHRQLVGLVPRRPVWVRARLNLRSYLVRPASTRCEVGRAGPPHRQQAGEPVAALESEAP